MNMNGPQPRTRPIVNFAGFGDIDDEPRRKRKSKNKQKQKRQGSAEKTTELNKTIGQVESTQDLMARGAAVSVLKELRSEEENDDSSYRVKFRERLVKTYKIALLAAESPDVWQEICDDTDWEGFKQAPKHDDQRDALRYVVRLFVGFGGPAATKKASKYYNSLKPWFERQARASAVRNALELEGGIEKLAQNAAVAQQVSDSSPPGISIQLSGSRAKKLRDYPAGTRVRITIDLQNTSSPSVVGRVRSLKKAAGSRGSKRKPRIELPPL